MACLWHGSVVDVYEIGCVEWYFFSTDITPVPVLVTLHQKTVKFEISDFFVTTAAGL